jgi:hypothetical protein
MYYSYVEIEYVAMSFSPARTDLALKLLILLLSLPVRVYYLMRCTHNALQGVIMNSFDSIESYFGCVSCFWQDRQDLTLLDGICIPFQYFTDFVVSWRLEWLGC